MLASRTLPAGTVYHVERRSMAHLVCVGPGMWLGSRTAYADQGGTAEGNAELRAWYSPGDGFWA